MKNLETKTLFVWMDGKPPKCDLIKDNKIVTQNILDDVITDPVKGHLFDLKNHKCLVHNHCNCDVQALTTVTFCFVGLPRRIKAMVQHLNKVYEAIEIYAPYGGENLQKYKEDPNKYISDMVRVIEEATKHGVDRH